MKRLWGLVVLALLSMLAASADEMVITSFDSAGRITFDEIATATAYRVEWASSPGGPWTSSWDSLDWIPAAGSGVVTAAVPMCYRVVASHHLGMVLIPAGEFVMGNATNVFPESEGGTDELPQHGVYVSAFWIDRSEVTRALWDKVCAWAATNGYVFDNTGSGKDLDHPVQTVNWFDAVKWCNARSEREGLTPCYTTNGATYRNDDNNSVTCNWSASGYRLPTEAEWEKASRGAAADGRFPWADYTNRISHAKANYQADSGSFSYDLSSGHHPTYATGGLPYTSPVGSFAPNGYGVYDIAGNVWEWCWDWYDSNYYASSPGSDPHGPGSGSSRVHRGGTWNYEPSFLRCANRHNDAPTLANDTLGFRCARGH